MKVILKTNIPNVGRKNEVVDMRSDAVRVYAALGKVERYTEPKPEPKPKRTYQRRDMKPEPVVSEPVDSDSAALQSEPVAESAEAVEISPRTGLPKRQYRRRDMQADTE